MKEIMADNNGFARVDKTKSIEICPCSNPNTLLKGKRNTGSIELGQGLLLKGWKARTFFNIVDYFNLSQFLEKDGLLQSLVDDANGQPLLTAFPPVEKFELFFFEGNYWHAEASFWENLKQKCLMFLLKRRISKWKKKFINFDVLMHFYVRQLCNKVNSNNEIMRKIVEPPPALLLLFDAIRNGILEDVISVLDKYKPDVNLNTNKGTVIALACRKGNIEIVKYLLEYGADSNFYALDKNEDSDIYYSIFPTALTSAVEFNVSENNYSRKNKMQILYSDTARLERITKEWRLYVPKNTQFKKVIELGGEIIISD